MVQIIASSDEVSLESTYRREYTKMSLNSEFGTTCNNRVSGFRGGHQGPTRTDEEQFRHPMQIAHRQGLDGFVIFQHVRNSCE